MKDQTIDILNKELNRGVNINYLRNVIISFLTSDKDSVFNKIINKIYLNIYFIQLFLQIKEGLLPVIFTSLQFSEIDIKHVNQAMQKKTDTGGIFNYFKK